MNLESRIKKIEIQIDLDSLNGEFCACPGRLWIALPGADGNPAWEPEKPPDVCEDCNRPLETFVVKPKED